MQNKTNTFWIKKIILLVLILFSITSCWSQANRNLNTAQKSNIVDKIWNQSLEKATKYALPKAQAAATARARTRTRAS